MGSKKKWTDDQKNAIYAKDKTLLVSAAAGSGKTAVLVERVINKITDPNNAVDIDNILIVTYTKAAAEEMKQRINLTLENMIAKMPNDKNLKRQMHLMSRAQISTIHSFCSRLIKDNFQKLSIAQNFKIANKTEINLLKQDAFEKVIKELYSQSDKSFLYLAELFSNDRDDSNLFDIIEKLYEELRPYPYKKDWVLEKLKLYKTEHDKIKENVFIKQLLEQASKAVKYCEKIADKNIEYSLSNEDFKKAYFEILTNDKLLLQDLKETIDNKSWNEICNKVNNFKSSMLRLKVLKGYNDDSTKQLIKANRDNIKKIIDTKAAVLFLCSEEEFIEDMKMSYPIVELIFKMEQMFSENLMELKKEKNILDFSDLEHLALELLVKDSDKGKIKTALADEISSSFEEIMIDEYQDINQVQESIFKAISRDEKNIFMVGDVKQSIYRFRNAQPELFLEKKNKFTEYDENTKDSSEKILLKKNFRSRKEILDAVNFVFKLVMSKEAGEIDYNEEELLNPGLDSGVENIPVDVHFIDFLNSPELDKDKTEAQYIAKLVINMVENGFNIDENGNKRKVEYGDFCILLRSAKKYFEIFENEFEKLGVPICTKKESNFFDTPEISGIISLLEVIDNPINDIELLSVMYGLIYSFTSDDIAKIRKKNINTEFYYALINISKDKTVIGKKCKDLLDDLFVLRQLSQTLSISQLIKSIYEKTGYDAMVSVMKNGELRLKKLRLLLEYAKDYESYGAKDLSGFLKFANKAKQRGEDFKSVVSGLRSNKAVNLMSMHSSKGLEFPICIVANTSRKFNFKSDSEVKMNSKLGIGFPLKDNTLLKKYSTIPDKAISIKNRNEALSEEIRVLYVAMTRAKQKLIISASFDDLEKAIINNYPCTYGERINDFFINQCSNAATFILACMMRYNSKNNPVNQMQNNKAIDKSGLFNVQIVPVAYDEITDNDRQEGDLTADAEMVDFIKNRFEEVYKYQRDTMIPTKVTVSELAFSDVNYKFMLSKRPKFSQKENITADQKGTIIHKFLSYADFKRLKTDITGVIKELLEKNIISEYEARVIDIEKIERFINTDIFNRILNADKVLKEYSFMVNIDAKDVYKSESFKGEN
ncbi:MAG: helicase-exonuclease AddAB subunit AddA, partial [Clostridia bacterium]|nr:helicase-exonuclease AddAB subunit AddA [Clostridia bacterium]